jgi:Xaa-Pro aminopeptidase
VSPLNGLPEPFYLRRLAAVRETLAQSGIDALLVTHPPNLRYLVGFDGSLGALIVSAAACVLVVDGRYVTAARERVSGLAELHGVSVALADRSLEEGVCRAVMAGARIYNLGIEAAAMTLDRFDRLAEAFGRAEAAAGGSASAPRLRSTERIVERARLVKDTVELATLRQAAALLSAVARTVPALVCAGRTERDIAADIDAALRRAGFDRPAFETIVASGPHSALPHARPGHRVLEPGDGVVLDVGGVYDGYCVDLTRTVQLAPGSEAFGQLFEAVRGAHAAAIRAVRPGVIASAVDAAARDVLTQRGLGDVFVHGTGHGLGLEVHEGPRIGKAGSGLPDEPLECGMVFTIEPGAYVPGLGGVRIEDDVLVVDGGCEVLTDVPIDQTGRAIDGPAGD